MMARTLAYRALIVLIPLTLAGCLMPLVPGEEDDSRLNVGDKVPDFIIIGRTTRADVLLALGEPDGESEHGEWFAYTRRTSTGGVLFFIATLGGAGGASTEMLSYRRLMIQFDDAGVVKSARHELVTCSEKELLIGRSLPKTEPIWVPPCAGSAQYHFPTDSVGERRSSEQNHGQVFAPACWYLGTRGFDRIRTFRQSTPETPSRGILVVGERSVLFFSPDADSKSGPLYEAAYPEVMGVYVDTFGLNRRVVIKRINGVYESFSIDKGVRVDVKLTESAGELIKSRWQAATNKSQR